MQFGNVLRSRRDRIESHSPAQRIEVIVETDIPFVGEAVELCTNGGQRQLRRAVADNQIMRQPRGVAWLDRLIDRPRQQLPAED